MDIKMIYLYSCGLLVYISGNLKEFRAFLTSDDETVNKIKQLSAQVEKFASQFPMPGIEDL